MGDPPRSRTVVIDPVTRIEGHAKISLHLDGDGRLTDARFHVVEYRGFEKFCEGHPFTEMAGITARICGICPVSHLLAAAKTGDKLLGLTIPPAAQKLRRLLNLAQIWQSHALSFFHLSSPDFLLGWECEPARRNLFGLMAADPDLARAGIRLRQFGQQILELLGGRKIHSAWAVPGGVRSPLSDDAKAWILERLPEARATARLALVLVRPLLLLAVVLQGLPALAIGHLALVALASRVSCAKDTEVEKAAHRSTHHGCGCCRSPIRAGPTGAIARDEQLGDTSQLRQPTYPPRRQQHPAPHQTCCQTGLGCWWNSTKASAAIATHLGM